MFSRKNAKSAQNLVQQRRTDYKEKRDVFFNEDVISHDNVRNLLEIFNHVENINETEIKQYE